MTQEETYDWLVGLMGAVLWLIAVCASILVLGFASGYAIEKYSRTEKCINSDCVQPCKTGARFVRHEGCVK